MKTLKLFDPREKTIGWHKTQLLNTFWVSEFGEVDGREEFAIKSKLNKINNCNKNTANTLKFSARGLVPEFRMMDEFGMQKADVKMNS